MINCDNLEKIGAGIECYVFQWAADIVLKVYYDSDDAKDAYTTQVQYEQYGLAPKTYKKMVTVLIGNGCISKGFLCEFVSIAHDEPGIYDDKEKIKFYENTYRNLRKKLEQHNNGEWTDLHNGNWGFTSDRKPVCIDFGNFSSSKRCDYTVRPITKRDKFEIVLRS